MNGSNMNLENQKTDLKILLSKKFIPVNSQYGGYTLSIDDMAATTVCASSLNNFLTALAFLEESKVLIFSGDDVYSFPLKTQDVLNLFYLVRKKAKSTKIKSRLAEKKEVGFRLGRPANARNDEEIRKLRQQGLTLREIAMKLKISISAVQRSLDFR